MVDIFFYVLLGLVVFVGIVCPLLFLIYDLLDLGDKFSDWWSAFKQKREELSEKRKMKSAERPFASQMRRCRFSYNYDKEENAYVMFCDGQPLKWKKFEPVKRVVYSYEDYMGVGFFGTAVNKYSWKTCQSEYEKIYNKELDSITNTPSYLKGVRLACDGEAFLFNENTYDVGLGTEEEAHNMLRILNMGSKFLSALNVNPDKPIYPSIWKKPNTEVWEAGVVVETDCGSDNIRFQFIPISFLSENELEEMGKHTAQTVKKKIITSREAIDI